MLEVDFKLNSTKSTCKYIMYYRIVLSMIDVRLSTKQ